jgi:hypothetical protein
MNNFTQIQQVNRRNYRQLGALIQVKFHCGIISSEGAVLPTPPPFYPKEIKNQHGHLGVGGREDLKRLGGWGRPLHHPAGWSSSPLQEQGPGLVHGEPLGEDLAAQLTGLQSL